MRSMKAVGYAGFLLCAGFAAGVQAQMNTCVAAVSGPRQGVHSQFDGSADAILWPPDHKLRTITISAQNDNGNECNVTITDAKQDEPVTGAGSGNTTPDAANCSNAGNSSSVDLRGERSGLGDGRYYHVMYTMDDPDAPGMPKMADALTLVPHDQGSKTISVNEGPLFESSGGATLQCSQ